MITTRSAAPILAAVLLLLPVLYVGSYLALVTPGKVRFTKAVNVGASTYQGGVFYETYRYGGTWAERVFWPLEQIDRKVRPEAWEWGKIGLEKQRSGSNW